jgi:predicted small integral membrane protein
MKIMKAVTGGNPPPTSLVPVCVYLFLFILLVLTGVRRWVYASGASAPNGLSWPRFCTTGSERVYITAPGCETGFAATRGL